MRVTLAALLLCVGVAACDRAGPPAAPDAPPGTEPGQAPPALEGVLPSGESYSMAIARGQRTVVLFYRSESCGLCRLRLEQLQTNLPAYSALGARVVAATLDPPELTSRTAERLDGDLQIVSVDTTTFEQWGMRLDDRRLPLPGAFVLDDRGVVIYRHVGSHAGDRISDATLLTILETEDG